MLPVLIILLLGLMAGGSQASDEIFLRDPVLERKTTRSPVTDGAVDPRPDHETGTKEIDDPVDTEETGIVRTECIHHDPELSISPSAAQCTSPGNPVEFSVIITNTSSTSCEPTTFDLTASAPHGWDISLDSETLQIAADWSTGVASMVVTPPEPASNGSHDISISASNERLSIESSATATCIVEEENTELADAPQEGVVPGAHGVGVNMAGPAQKRRVDTASRDLTAAEGCIPEAPGLVFSPASPADGHDKTPVFAITLINNDPPACADSSFDLSITYLPQGWSGTLAPRKMTLAPGIPGTATLTVIPSANATADMFKLQIGVSDALSPKQSKTSMTSHSHDATGSFILDDSRSGRR